MSNSSGSSFGGHSAYKPHAGQASGYASGATTTRLMPSLLGGKRDAEGSDEEDYYSAEEGE